MTRKARLQAWAAQLNAPVPADANVAQLEAAIETALAAPATPDIEIPSFRDSVAIHWNIARAEVPATAKAIAQNLLN